jgi:hypothetical protein
MTNRTTLDRLVVAVIALALTIVVLAPVALSFHSLSDWARTSLALTGWWVYVVPVALDAAALTCVGLTFHAVLRADSAAGPRALMWALALASSTANARHGSTIGADAVAFYAAMPLVAMVLLDITLRRVRRSALAGLGGIEPPLPRFRGARWLPGVGLRETAAAWRAAVLEGFTSPAEAVQAVRLRREGAVPNVAETPHQLAAQAAELAELSKADQLRAAFRAVGETSAPRALTWLARRGVEVSARYAHEVAAAERDRTPELRAIEGGGAS